MIDAKNIKAFLEKSGKYSDLKENNEGANAIAFTGFHNHLERNVFLKIPDYVEADAKEILKEARILAESMKTGSQCKNIVQVYDAEILTIGTNPLLCIQMECIDGPSLYKYLSDNRIGQQYSVRITQGILNGTNFLHSLRLVHRDLKPSNILISNEIPKISDFGSVARLGEGVEFVRASKHSALYVPPEGWENPSRYGFQSDIYQVGMVMYELINGSLESNADNYVSSRILRAIGQTRDYDSLDDFNKTMVQNQAICYLAKRQKLLECGRPAMPYFSSRLKKIVKKATNPNPYQRYLSASQMLSDLARISLPNWVQVSPSEFQAESWKNYSWKIYTMEKRSGLKIFVERTRQGASKVSKRDSYNSLEQAFSSVENY